MNKNETLLIGVDFSLVISISHTPIAVSASLLFLALSKSRIQRDDLLLQYLSALMTEIVAAAFPFSIGTQLHLFSGTTSYESSGICFIPEDQMCLKATGRTSSFCLIVHQALAFRSNC